MALFRIVTAQVAAWIGREKPYQFFFSGADPRRTAIYRWLARRAARRLPDYWHYELGTTFYFFRRADASADVLGRADGHGEADPADLPTRGSVHA